MYGTLINKIHLKNNYGSGKKKYWGVWKNILETDHVSMHDHQWSGTLKCFFRVKLNLIQDSIAG